MTAVFFTIDTELVWRHHADGLAPAEVLERSLDPAGVGIGYQLARLAEANLKACFFVDPMPALAHGLAPIREVIRQIRDAGQEVQLHLHPCWIAASLADRTSAARRFELVDYSRDEQHALIAGARDLLVAAGAPVPVAFRGGSYSANDDTLAVLAELGIAYDSSHNGAEHPWPSHIGLDPRAIAPVERNGVTEVPLSVIEPRPGELRTFQICALSTGEMRAALDHAVREDHAAVTIVTHGFELANRAGTAPNALHLARFEALCNHLATHRAHLPTLHFADRPVLPLGRADAPLGPSLLRTGWRRAEQLWSNLIAERAA